MSQGARRGERPKGYEDTEIYVLAKQLAVEIYRMTLEELPRFEMYEEGSQIRSEMLHKTGGRSPERFEYFYNQYRRLGAMLYNYREAAIQGRV